MTTPALSIHQPEAADARSLSDRAYYRIRELIVTLELPPGSLVSERELMERLGLGRTPVREALRALARDRLVEVYPRRGMFVSSEFAKSGSPALKVVRKFKWTSTDQNFVSNLISGKHMDKDKAAALWVAKNKAKVASWLK